MRILVVSDTHGNIEKAKFVYDNIDKVDMIIHCGDYLADGRELEAAYNTPCHGVKGNCDRTTAEYDYETVETTAGKILVCHGDLDGVDLGYQRVYYKALERDCVAVVYGHTHKAFYKKLDDMLIVNPGSLARPRDGSNGTCALLTIIDKNIECDILDYDTIKNNSKKTINKKPTKKVQGGFLRGMINYSDRF